MLDSDPASKTPRFGDKGSFQPFPSGLGPVNEPNDICFEIDPAGQISMAGTSGAMLKNAKKPKKKRQSKQKQLPNT